MIKETTYKRQGDGQDSWIIRYLDDSGIDVIPPEIVYEDPEKPKKINIENIDLETLPPDQLKKLAEKLKSYL